MSLRTLIILGISGLGLILSVLFFLTWIPSAENRSQNILQHHLHGELSITAEAIIPLLLQNQYANIYESLDALVEGNEEWVSI